MMRNTLISAALAAVIAGAWLTPAMAATLQATPATFNATLAQAKGGDTVQLAPGTYAGWRPQYLNWSPGIVITSADPAHPAAFTGFLFSKSSGITLRGVELVVQPPGYFMFGVDTSSDIHFDHVSVHGSLDGNPTNDAEGIGMINSSNVSITNSEFQQLLRAVSINTTKGVTFAGNHVHDVEATGIVMAAVTGVAITGNSFHDFFPAGGDHPDAIQFETRGQPTASANIEVSDNLIALGAGRPTQGIFFRDQVETLPFTGVVVRDNLVIGTGAGGIYANGLHGGAILDNVLLSFPGSTTPLVVELSDSVDVRGNQALSIGKTADVTNTSLAANAQNAAVSDGGVAILRAWLAVHPLMAPLAASALPPVPADPRDAQIAALAAQLAAGQKATAALQAQIATAKAALQ